MSNQGKETNYNFAKGDIINQSGSFVVGVDKSKKIMLDQSSIDYPSNASNFLHEKAADEVEKSPELKSRILWGVRVGIIVALKMMIDNPLARFFIEVAREVLKP